MKLIVAGPLASPDAADAFRAMARLADDPAAMMNVRGRLRPAQPISAEQLAGWVRDLDSGQFATRQQAAAALKRAGPQAEAVLREAAKSTSAEVRSQATALLADVANLTGERLADVPHGGDSGMVGHRRSTRCWPNWRKGPRPPI